MLWGIIVNLRAKEHANYTQKKTSSISLLGRSVCITGTLKMNRKEAQKELSNLGAYYKSDIKGADYLIVGKTRGDKDTSKMTEADSRMIPIISHHAFYKMIKEK